MFTFWPRKKYNLVYVPVCKKRDNKIWIYALIFKNKRIKKLILTTSNV